MRRNEGITAFTVLIDPRHQHISSHCRKDFGVPDSGVYDEGMQRCYTERGGPAQSPTQGRGSRGRKPAKEQHESWDSATARNGPGP